jgi:dihydroorotate dehydrogenase
MNFAKLGFNLAQPLLRRLDAELAHGLAIKALKAGLGGAAPSLPRIPISRFGLRFENPLGLAAGFDKNAEAPDAMLACGFGFVEVGTVTPKPQPGNPRPRLFRLVEDQAVINRMGFNNEGHSAAFESLRARRHRPGLIGVNLGANRDASDRAADYVAGINAFSGLASYFTINISSPNTPGLRNLQAADELRPLLQRLNDARRRQDRHVPMLLKIAPDLDPIEMKAIADCCLEAEIDGVVISNTTISRPPLRSRHAREQGGLSGQPLFELSTSQLARFYVMTEGKIPLIGVGGISNTEQAWGKICAGASLLQIYSALVFHGPALIEDILTGLDRKLLQNKMTKLEEAIGSSAREIAHHNPFGR